MVCIVKMFEKPVLSDPILIEGLPGIGLVANIATLHLIKELKANRFGEIHCSSFQDLAVTANNGEAHFPINELYYYKRKDGERDLIILYGNTQALTVHGQYELCGRILDIVEELGCRSVITLGGLKRERPVTEPKLYCAASDIDTLRQATDSGAEIVEGQIFGVAGLLIGLSDLRKIKGLCLLTETSGYPDEMAARLLLNGICMVLDLKVDMDRMNITKEMTCIKLESFGLITHLTKEKRRYNLAV